MAHRGRVRLWRSIAGVTGSLLVASSGVLCHTGPAVAQTSEQVEGETSEVEGIGDWILRLFQNSGEATDEPRPKDRDGNSKNGAGGGNTGGGGDGDDNG